MTETMFQKLIEQELKLIKELLLQINVKNEGHIKGTALEFRLRSLFSKMVPSFCLVSNGWIIDEKGNKSDERDLLVYNKDKAPQILFDIGTGIFPIESIEYDIQVKNSITDKSFKQAYDKFDKRTKRNVLLGISGTNLFKKYTKIDPKYLHSPKICAFASEDDKYYFFSREKMKYKKIFNINKLQPDNGPAININNKSCNFTINGNNLSEFGEKEISICRWFCVDLKPQSNILGFINGFVNTLYREKTGKYFYDFSNRKPKCLTFVVFDNDGKQIFQASDEELNKILSFETNAAFRTNGSIELSIKAYTK